MVFIVRISEKFTEFQHRRIQFNFDTLVKKDANLCGAYGTYGYQTVDTYTPPHYWLASVPGIHAPSEINGLVVGRYFCHSQVKTSSKERKPVWN